MKAVMFTGDSITDCGRVRPVGDRAGTLGDSYVGNIFVQMWAADPHADVKIMNTGTGGNTSRDLLARLDGEVLCHKSDYLFIMIGVNDCAAEFYDRVYAANAPTVEEYRDNMEKIIGKALAAGTKPVLISPYYLDLNKKDPMRAKCDRINAVLRELCGKYSLHYIDVQGAFDDYLEKSSVFFISPDRVHPKAIGRQIITRTVMNSEAWREVISK